MQLYTYPPRSALANLMLAERDWPISVAAAFGLGLAYAVILLGPNVAFGVAQYWNMPHLNGGTLDIQNALAGYWWFSQDSWRWPLLTLHNANWPAGTNAELFDICPLAAIIGKLLRTTLGWSINPYPWWVTGCFIMNSVGLASLVRALGNRSLLGSILAGAFGAMAPVVQQRLSLGHMSLLAHWVPLLTLALYFKTKSQRLDSRVVGAFVGLKLLAAFLHLYIYIIVAAIAAGAFVQSVIDHRASLGRGLLSTSLLVLAGIVSIWFLGLVADGDLLTTQGQGYGTASMNLVTPFWPQTSGLFRWTGIYWLSRGSIGATVGQYEGFNYLGGGALMLLGVAIWRDASRLRSIMQRHFGFFIVLIILIVWALSNRVYFGPYLIYSYDVPHFLLNTILSWFRCSGRFFWPVGWLLVGAGIARGLAPVRSASALILVGVIGMFLQWGDTAPWREKFGQLLNTTPTSAFGSPPAAAQIDRAIKTARAVAVIPSVFCSSAGSDYGSPLNVAALEIQLMAARANARMPYVYLSRHMRCGKTPDLGAPSVLILLKDEKSFEHELPPIGSHCYDFPIARMCLVDTPLPNGSD
jgi:hypothetical protein